MRIFKRLFLYTFVLLNLFYLFSFQQKKQADSHKMDAKAWYDWYLSPEYPFRDTIQKSDIQFVYEWIPYEVEVARNVLQGKFSIEKAKQEIKHHPNDEHFELTIILPRNGVDIYNYELNESENSTTRTTYYSFNMQKDLFIKEETSDTIFSNGFMHYRGLSNFPRAKFAFYFQTIKSKCSQKMIFYDRIFTESSFEFELKNYITQKLPKLTL